MLACQEVLKRVWPSLKQYGLLHTSLKTTSKHAPQLEINILYAKQPIKNHRGPTPDEKYR